MQNIIHGPVDFQGVRDIVTQKREPVARAQGLDIGQAAGDEIIDANDLMLLFQKTFAQVRADEARSSGYDGSHASSSKRTFASSRQAGKPYLQKGRFPLC
jgi:hypothetical protein